MRTGRVPAAAAGLAPAVGVVAVVALTACTGPTRDAAPASSAQVPSATATATARPLPPPPGGPPSTIPTVRPATTPPPRTYVQPVRRYPGPAAVALVLREADAVIHDRTATAAAVAEAGQAQQRAYRELVVTPEWREEVYAALPGRARAHARDCVLAGAELRSFTRPQKALPDWRIVPAAPAADLLRFYRESGRRHGIDWTYLAAINLVETRMGRLRGISSAGARGPMQFLPSTWAEVGRGDIDDPRDAIDGAARYLVRRGGRESIARGVRGYNPSDHYVRAVLAYAAVLQRDPAAYRGFYHWQVYYRMAAGDVVLLEGYRGPGR